MSLSSDHISLNKKAVLKLEKYHIRFNGIHIGCHKVQPSHSKAAYFLEKYIIQMRMCRIYNRHSLLYSEKNTLLSYTMMYGVRRHESVTQFAYIRIVHVVHWTITMLDWFTSLAEQPINERLWPDVSAKSENSLWPKGM